MTPLEAEMLEALLQAAQQIEYFEMARSEARAILNDNHKHRTVESLQIARKNYDDAVRQIREAREKIKTAVAKGILAKRGGAQ